MTPYEEHWVFRRWEALGARIVLNADVWARLGRAAERAGLVVGKEQHAKEADANSPG